MFSSCRHHDVYGWVGRQKSVKISFGDVKVWKKNLHLLWIYFATILHYFWIETTPNKFCTIYTTKTNFSRSTKQKPPTTTGKDDLRTKQTILIARKYQCTEAPKLTSKNKLNSNTIICRCLAENQLKSQAAQAPKPKRKWSKN